MTKKMRKYRCAQAMKILLTYIGISIVMSFVFGATIVWWQIFHDSSFWLSLNRFIWFIGHQPLTLLNILLFSRYYVIYNILKTKERTGKPEIKTQYISLVWPIFNLTILCKNVKAASKAVSRVKVEYRFIPARNKSLCCIKKTPYAINFFGGNFWTS